MMTLLLTLALATSCGASEETGDKTAELVNEMRSSYLELSACGGSLELTADYGQRVYTYSLDFVWQREGTTTLTITAPETVAGTVATIETGETALSYDGVRVETGALDSRGLSPMDALPALLTAAQEGYLAEAVLEDWEEGQRLHVISRDPQLEPGTGVETDLWFDPDTFALCRGEISEGGMTVISCECSGFTMERGVTG